MNRDLRGILLNLWQLGDCPNFMRKEDTRSILVAEDDPDDRLIYKDAIQSCQCKVSCSFVENGEELIEYLQDESNPRPSLIIMDRRMPGMSFGEVITAIEDDPQLKNIPLVVVTGSSASGETKTFGKPTVTKPTTFEDWVQTLNKIFISFLCPKQNQSHLHS